MIRRNIQKPGLELSGAASSKPLAGPLYIRRPQGAIALDTLARMLPSDTGVPITA